MGKKKNKSNIMNRILVGLLILAAFEAGVFGGSHIPASPANLVKDLTPAQVEMVRTVLVIYTAASLPTPTPTTSPEKNINDLIYDVSFLDQCDDRWSEVPVGMGRPGTKCVEYNWIMCNSGCAITSMSMILNYFGDSVLPPSLHNFLKDRSNGYQEDGCNINVWAAAAHYGLIPIWTRDYWKYPKDRNVIDAELKSTLREYGPLVVGVLWPTSGTGHVVVAYGIVDDEIVILDPLWNLELKKRATMLNEYEHITWAAGFQKEMK